MSGEWQSHPWGVWDPRKIFFCQAPVYINNLSHLKSVCQQHFESPVFV